MKVKILTRNFSQSNKKNLACPSYNAMISYKRTLLFGIAIATLIVFLNYSNNMNMLSAYAQGEGNSSLTSPTNTDKIPSAQSVYDSGKMQLSSDVNGFIISIPDEGHHPISDQKTISPNNPHYLPNDLTIPSGTSIAFVHGDPNHIHSETMTDKTGGNVVWQTSAVKHPGGSDVKILPAGTYDITDKKYPDMTGTITVSDNEKSSGNLVAGGLFVPTSSLDKYKTDFKNAGLDVASTYDFTSKTVQKDINGPNTLIIYTTSQPIPDAISKLLPIIDSLPYK